MLVERIGMIAKAEGIEPLSDIRRGIDVTATPSRDANRLSEREFDVDESRADRDQLATQ